MSQNTESKEQQTLWAVYDSTLFFAESRKFNNEKALDFLEADFELRQESLFGAWEAAGQPQPDTQELVNFVRSFFGI